MFGYKSINLLQQQELRKTNINHCFYASLRYVLFYIQILVILVVQIFSTVTIGYNILCQFSLYPLLQH
jgi:hypothetical protein